LASEKAIVASYIFEDAFPYATNESNHEGAWAQATSFQTSKLIDIYSKRSLHFCKDCGIFCEGEWEQQRHLDGHTGLVDFIGVVGLVGLVGFICIVNFIGVIGVVGIVGVNGFVVGIIGLVMDLIGRNGLIGCIGCNGNIGRKIIFGGIIKLLKFGIAGQVGLVGLVDIGNLGLVGHSGLSLVSHSGLSLVGHTGLRSFDGHTGLVRYTGLAGLINLVGLNFIGLVGLIGRLVHRVGISLNGFIGFSIIAISLSLARIDFEIGTKHSQRFSFVKESWLWCVRRVIFDSLIPLWPDFCFEKALQNAKQLFFIRLQQMTKYFVMRECENIPTWISLCVTTVFSQQGGISVFKFPCHESDW